MELRYEVKIIQKTARCMLRHLRKAWEREVQDLSDPVEVDESYFPLIYLTKPGFRSQFLGIAETTFPAQIQRILFRKTRMRWPRP